MARSANVDGMTWANHDAGASIPAAASPDESDTLIASAPRTPPAAYDAELARRVAVHNAHDATTLGPTPTPSPSPTPTPTPSPTPTPEPAPAPKPPPEAEQDSVFWAGVKGFGLGLVQGGANVVNGVQDGLIGIGNLPGRAYNATAGALTDTAIPRIPSPDWSKDLVVEGDEFHDLSKGLGGGGVLLLSGVGAVGSLAKVGQVLDKADKVTAVLDVGEGAAKVAVGDYGGLKDVALGAAGLVPARAGSAVDGTPPVPGSPAPIDVPTVDLPAAAASSPPSRAPAAGDQSPAATDHPAGAGTTPDRTPAAPITGDGSPSTTGVIDAPPTRADKDAPDAAPTAQRIEAEKAAAAERWQGTELRGNEYAGSEFEAKYAGRAVDTRVALGDAKPGAYQYTVDERGRMWLGNVEKHSELVPVGERVYSAGHLEIGADRMVNANAASGHYMQEMPLIYPAEIDAWTRAMAATIEQAGLKPGTLTPGIGGLR